MNKITKLAFVSNSQLNAEKGGAEVFNERIVEYLKKYIPHVEHIAVPCSEATFEDILKGYQTCYDIDLNKFDGVVSSKAPTFAIRHSNHICYLLHPIRVFYDMFDEINTDSSNLTKYQLIHRIDNELLRPPHTKKLFSIGYEVNKRLEYYNGVSSTVLHPGIPAGDYYCKDYNYIFMPGRLHKWKRVGLVIEAMKYVHAPVKLKIAGTGDIIDELQVLAGNDARIEFLGYISDDAMKELYSNALVVLFTPIREDYGFVLHEGFKSRKPVIVCNDSGEPSLFVKHDENGFISAPEPKEIAKYIDKLYNEKGLAKSMGDRGFDSISHITWDNVVQTLIKALEE